MADEQQQTAAAEGGGGSHRAATEDERTGIQQAFALRRERAGAAERDMRQRAWVRLRSEAESHSDLFFQQARVASNAEGGARLGIYVTVQNPQRVFERQGRAYRLETLAELEKLDALAAAATAALEDEDQRQGDDIDIINNNRMDSARPSGASEYRAALRVYAPAREFVFAAHFEPTSAEPRPATFSAVLAGDACERYWRCERVGCRAEARGSQIAAAMPERCRCERCGLPRYCSPACRAAAARGGQHPASQCAAAAAGQQQRQP